MTGESLDQQVAEVVRRASLAMFAGATPGARMQAVAFVTTDDDDTEVLREAITRELYATEFDAIRFGKIGGDVELADPAARRLYAAAAFDLFATATPAERRRAIERALQQPGLREYHETVQDADAVTDELLGL